MSDEERKDDTATADGADEGRPISNRLLGGWRDIKTDPPNLDGLDRWILVVNSAGFPAAVNELGGDNFRGYSTTAEENICLISDIKWWQEITLP